MPLTFVLGCHGIPHPLYIIYVHHDIPVATKVNVLHAKGEGLKGLHTQGCVSSARQTQGEEEGLKILCETC